VNEEQAPASMESKRKVIFMCFSGIFYLELTFHSSGESVKIDLTYSIISPSIFLSDTHNLRMDFHLKHEKGWRRVLIIFLVFLSTCFLVYSPGLITSPGYWYSDNYVFRLQTEALP